MTKLKKYSLEGLEKTFESMKDLEKSMLIGGGMEYYFNSTGHVVSTKVNDLDYDQAFCGSNFCSSYKLNGELMISSHPWGLQPSVTVTEIKGGDWGLFKFLADNTSVEWEATLCRDGDSPAGSTACAIRTINNREQAPGEYEIGTSNNSYVHSHPNNDSCPSVEDRFDSDTMRSKGYDQGIYTPKSGNVYWF